MTDKPTLKEIENLFVDETGFDIDDFPAAIFDFARAVLTKWGQPDQAAEPVAWAFKYDDGTWHDPSTTEHSPGMRPLCAAPQPVARVPLDDARRMFDAGWKAAALLCDREDVVADGIIGFGACPQFEAAFSAAQPVAREPLPKFLALKFHARRDKKATVTLLFPGHEAADAWVRGIKGGQHGTE